MKKYINRIIVCLLMAIPCSSCSDFFDNEPDNLDTMEKVFQRRQSTLEFLANVYSYIRPPYNWSNETIWAGVSDEIDVTYTDYEISKINLGLLAPDKESLFYGNLWSHYYAGIRAATYFMNHVDQNIELKPTEIAQYKAEARGLRAWFYFCLIRQYGPVVILSDDLVEGDASVEEMNIARSSISQCFNYVTSELNGVIDGHCLLDVNITDSRDPRYLNKNDYGRITEVACKAIKARVLLYAASDLYNRDKTTPLFKSFKNIDGSYMMDYTNEGATERWEAAVQATEEVFKYTDFALYKAPSADPYESYQNIFIVDWNSEIIWAKPAGGFWEMDLACSPRFVKGWSGWGVTQEMVDAYFMKNGESPILGYNADGSPVINQKSGYVEEGFTTSTGDDGYTMPGTYKMYAGREPRFYVSVCFDNSKWMSKFNQTQVQFWYGGNTGRTDKETRNYSQTGYLCRKLVNPNSNIETDQKIEHAAILFRLGEFYLNYAEALNEANFDKNKSTVLKYLNDIRKRAGIPGYGEQGLAVPSTQEEMREVIRRERRVELGFEEARYFDCIRWGVAHQYFNGQKYGMNVNDPAGKSAFYKRTLFETRTFPEHNLLWPVPLSDIYKANKLVQNPEWSSISSSDMEE